MADVKQVVVRSLSAILASAAAAAMVMTSVPADESGRKVAVTIAPTGTATIRHISGPQYLSVYLDAVRVPTACDGITGPEIRIGKTFTEAQCTAMLDAALAETGTHVIACVPPLYGRANQAAAAVSLAYNIGWPSFCRSTAARLFNAGRWAAGCDAFTMWVKAKGRILPGLVARRARERVRCLTGLAV